ncbi:MAG: efflux RND transporter periplasmic adaptor subunit [Vicinamibacterales bacterium]
MPWPRTHAQTSRVALALRGACVAGLIVASAIAAGGCRQHAPAQQADSPPSPLQIGRESVATVQTQEIRTGPTISGELSAETQATVRAQVGGSIVRMLFEEGQTVKRGAVLAQIEARDLQQGVASADVAVQTAQQALELAQREVQRTDRLVSGGALSQRDLDTARNALATAQSQLAAAQARATSARAQLGDTTVRSPISGVVARKPANAGDVVTPGSELYTLIDPSSMRLEASVPADQIGGLRVGVPVSFTVKGYDDRFNGQIVRISPAADPSTRQVPIFVSIPNTNGALIAGLFAEGRVETDVKRALVVPGTAIEGAEGNVTATRVKDGKAEKVNVRLGVRDRQTERVEIVQGLGEGDVVLTGAARDITPGTPVVIVSRDAATTSQ